MSDSDRNDEGNQMNDRPERRHSAIACPQVFIDVGAASIMLRHAMEAGDDCVPFYDALTASLDVAKNQIKKYGIAHVDIAEGELFMFDARAEYVRGNKERAILLQKTGHGKWAMVLRYFGIETPTDDEIKVVHAKQAEEKRAAKRELTAYEEKLAVAANGR